MGGTISPTILIWHYSDEETERLNRFFCEIDVPEALSIAGHQGHLLVHEILFGEKRSEEEFCCDEKVMLFYNLPAQDIHAVMQQSRDRDLPRPIYAMVTEQNIAWRFSDLVEHLIEERDFIARRRAQKDQKHGRSPH